MTRLLYVLFAGVLLLAAYLKGAALIDGAFAVATTARPTAWQATVGWTTVGAEYVLAVWLLAGVAVQSARRVAVAALGVFVVVNAIAVFRGDESCGCFGSVAINPLWTLLADLGLLAGFVLLRPRQQISAETPSRRHSALAGAGTVLLPLGLATIAVEVYRAADVLYSPTATSHLGLASHSRSTPSAGLFSGV